MSTHLRSAIIGAVCVFAIGGPAVAQARTLLASAGTPSPTGDFTHVHLDHGRLDNTGSEPFDADIAWTTPLPVDNAGTRTVTFNASGDGDSGNTTHQTRCQTFTVGANAVVLTTGTLVSTSSSPSIAPYSAGTVNVVSGASLGMLCFVPPKAAGTISGRVISFDYAP